jgi:signal transduction histidine kinase
VTETAGLPEEADESTALAPAVLAWLLLAVTLVFDLIGAALLVASGRAHEMLVGVTPLGFAVVGFILATKRRRNPLGWLMLVAAMTFSFPGDIYAYYATITRHGTLPGAGVANALADPTWVPFIGCTGLLLLLFPDGHLPSPRWRWFTRLCVAGMCIGLFATAVQPTTFSADGLPQLRNPFFLRIPNALGLLSLVVPILVAGGATALIVRLRRSTDPEERRQLRWVAWAASVLAVLYVLAFVVEILNVLPGSDQWNNWVGAVAIVSFVIIPISIGVAVMKYRLYDIDIVIRKTVVFAVVAGFIALVYVAVVVGVGTLVGTQGSPILSAIAAAIVALVFQPVRARAGRFADRVVYGKRATPYEVLAQLGGRLSDTYDADEVLPRLARVLAEGVGARRARVLLRVDGKLQPVATWPVDADEGFADDFSTEVRHQGEDLGALSLAMPANDPMDPNKEQLVADLASQVGLLLRNVRLTEDLKSRLADLQAAQKRLVSAQDEERRRIERNIHDGAQQQLVALAVKMKLADGLVDRDPTKAHALLEQLRADAAETLTDLRDLARGIYPPLLADKGLLSALEAQARKSPVTTTVLGDGIGRFGQDVEAAVYFSCLEAMQNVAKYASASEVTIRLANGDGSLTFEVHDDGVGFDPQDGTLGTGLQGMADRLGVLGGALEVRSSPGTGTTVAGSLPVFSSSG